MSLMIRHRLIKTPHLLVVCKVKWSGYEGDFHDAVL
jgi:hypothetical protein